MGVYDQVKQAIQDFVAPEIQSIRGDIRVLTERIDAADARLSEKISALDGKLDHLDAKLTIKIDSFRNEMVSEIRRLDTRMDGFDKRIEGFGRELGAAMEIRERLAALEARRPG
jgi:hypothetical protein